MEEVKQDLAEEEAILPEEEAAPGRDYAAEVKALYEARPELRGEQLPDEVVAACVGGKSLTAAYGEYMSRHRQQARMEQRQSRAPRRPAVKSVTSGGATQSQGEDPFLRGFNAGW